MNQEGYALGFGRTVHAGWMYGAILLGLCPLNSHGQAIDLPAKSPYRMAITSSIFLSANQNDARSAMAVWIGTLAKNLTIPVDSEPIMFEDVDAVAKSSAADQIDGFGLTTEEFSRLKAHIPFDRIAATVQEGRVTEEYILLVRQESSFSSVEQLAGQRLFFLSSSRTSLARIWLDSLLLTKGLPPAAEFFAPIVFHTKPSRAVLPVFFKQADACLLTRRSFDVMSEQNPQLGKQLRVLVSSPGVIPILFAFRSDHSSVFREEIMEQMKNLAKSEAGRQILNFIQADAVIELPFSELEGSLDLISHHRALLAARSPGSTGGSVQSSPLAKRQP